MRTTVTLDPDVEILLKEATYRSGRPFKTTLNDAIRTALAPRRAAAPPMWPVFAMGMPRIDLIKAASLSDELDDQTALAKLQRGA